MILHCLKCGAKQKFRRGAVNDEMGATWTIAVPNPNGSFGAIWHPR